MTSKQQATAPKQAASVPAPAPEQSPGTAELMGNSFMNELLSGGDGGGAGMNGCTYTVSQGDTLSHIAREVLGDGSRWDELYEVPQNRSTIGADAGHIEPGQELSVCLEGGEEASEANQSVPEGTEVTVAEPESATDEVALALEARDALEGELTGLSGLTPEAREAILARVGTLAGPALVQEMRVISHACASANPARALSAMVDIHGIAGQSEDATERLSPDVVEALVRGVADARSESDRGQEGTLGGRGARNAANAMVNMD